MERLFDAWKLSDAPAEAALYEAGLALVADHGLGPADILWDADEVLWDWAIGFGRLLPVSPKVILRHYGHREWIALRPGMTGLLAGLHDGAARAGQDPYMRIWTAGYPWRLWRIFQEIPAFTTLLGPGPGGLALSPEALAAHPRVMARGDLVRIILALLDDTRADGVLADIPPEIRPMVERQCRQDPGHGGFKIPELARVAGKPEVATTSILVDDTRANIDWFLGSGRQAVWVRSPTPRVLFGKVPNSLWRRPDRWLAGLRHALVPGIADALGKVWSEGGLAVAEPIEEGETRGAFPPDAAPPVVFPIDIPNGVFWKEWFGPMKAVKRAARAARKRRGPAPSGDDPGPTTSE